MPAMAVPLAADKLDAWEAWVAELHGPRKAEFDDMNARLGLTEHRAYLQPTPDGNFLTLVVAEGTGGDTFLANVLSSDHEFDPTVRRVYRRPARDGRKRPDTPDGRPQAVERSLPYKGARHRPRPLSTRAEGSRRKSVVASPAPGKPARMQELTGMAPGGVEPPHVDSKSTALSAELRGQVDRHAIPPRE